MKKRICAFPAGFAGIWMRMFMKKQNHCKKGVQAAALLLAALAVMLVCTTAFAAGFTDVPENHWAYGAISEAAADGVIKGVGDNRFDPNGNVTLAQSVVILTRTYWPDEIAANESTGPWYARNVDVGFDHNLFRALDSSGVQGEYDYGAPVTRAMMAQLVCNAMLANGAKSVSDIQSVLGQMPDVSPDHPFVEGIAFCCGSGILQGVDKDGNFSPEGTLTRAQAATIYVRCKNGVTAGPDGSQITRRGGLVRLGENSAAFWVGVIVLVFVARSLLLGTSSKSSSGSGSSSSSRSSSYSSFGSSFGSSYGSYSSGGYSSSFDKPKSERTFTQGGPTGCGIGGSFCGCGSGI